MTTETKVGRIDRKGLLAGLQYIIEKAEGKDSQMFREANAANAHKMAKMLIDYSDYQPHRAHLRHLIEATEHLRDYNEQLTEFRNKNYGEVTEPINRQVIYPILKKYLSDEDIPYCYPPSKHFPNAWHSHSEGVCFHSNEQMAAAARELEPHVVFDQPIEQMIREASSRNRIGYDLKNWQEAHYAAITEWCNSIED